MSTASISSSARHAPDTPVAAMATRRLLYVEPEADGHHLAVYAAAIWEKLIGEGWTICWLTSHHAIRTATAIGLIHRFGAALEVRPYSFLRIPNSGGRPMSWIRYQTHHRRILNLAVPELVNEAPTACVFLPWLDYCDRSCGMFGLPEIGVPMAALHMHVSIHEPVGPNPSFMRRLSRSITTRSLARLYTQKNLKRIAVIMETFASFARSTGLPGSEKIVYIPDAGSLGDTPPRQASRERYSLAEGEVAILCFGALTRRKGVDLLLAASRAFSGSASIVVILAGKQEPEVRAMVARFQLGNKVSSMRLLVRDTFVDASEERSLFAASDIVWVGYPGFFGSSSVLIQAGCACLPVVAGIQGETGSAVREAQCGIACDLSSATEVAAAVRTLALEPDLRSRMGRNGAERSKHHSPQIFASNVLKMIEETAAQGALAQ